MHFFHAERQLYDSAPVTLNNFTIVVVFVTNSKTMELEDLQDTNKTLIKELQDLRRAHQKEVREQSL